MKRGAFGINRICRLAGISKATFYRHKNPADTFEEKYSHLKKKVEKTIQKNPAYGIRRIKQALLNDFNAVIGRDTLGKMLKIWGLSLKRKIRKNKRNVIQKILIALKDRANLLSGTDLVKPLQAVTSDISEFVFNQGKGKAYLAVHKDALGQMVYGCEIGQNMETGLVLESLRRATAYLKSKKIPIPRNTLFHSDQGSQYTSYEYVNAILKIGKLSYSAPGTPTDNPGQESFFGRFKDEWKDEVYEMKSFAEAKEFIQEKIKYYNYKRLHTSIKNQTPYFFTKNSL